MESVAGLVLRLMTGRFPTEAWITVQVGEFENEVLEWCDLSRTDAPDFRPALAWAAGCSLAGCPCPPDGWRLDVCDCEGHAVRCCDA